MIVHVLLIFLNELRKRDLPNILSLLYNELNKFNKTRAQMLDSTYHMTFRLLCNLISNVKKGYNFIFTYTMLLWTT